MMSVCTVLSRVHGACSRRQSEHPGACAHAPVLRVVRSIVFAGRPRGLRGHVGETSCQGTTPPPPPLPSLRTHTSSSLSSSALPRQRTRRHCQSGWVWNVAQIPSSVYHRTLLHVITAQSRRSRSVRPRPRAVGMLVLPIDCPSDSPVHWPHWNASSDFETALRP